MTCWRIGLVNAATRNGKVKEVFSRGSVQKTITKSAIIEKVLHIPRDQVRADDLLVEAEAQEWQTLAECEQFVARFMLSPAS